MKYCANDACPDLQRDGLRGEYRDGVEICPKCDSPLAEGAAPVRFIETRWVDYSCIGTFRDPTAAHIARTRLESADIPCIVNDDQVSGVHWLYSLAVGGVKVCVPAELAEEARRVLARDESAALRGVAEAGIPPKADEVCPNCGAAAAEPSRLGIRSRALSLLVGLPFVFWRNSLHCGRCGHRWRPGRAAA